MKKKIICTSILFLFFIFICLISTVAQKKRIIKKNRIITGAEQKWLYLSYIGKRPFAVVANQTSMIGKSHLVDTLLSSNCNLKKIFCPEHGFRGDAEAGALLNNSVDSKTGLPIISLYGNKKKPSPEDLKDIDIILFDIQDVGARFYTYISTLALVMEACAENNKTLLILDRPNPNGFYVDGPILDRQFNSFVGMIPIPIVHGMTMAEIARMINDEGWINGICSLDWIKCKNYTHKMKYVPPIAPSPNLKSIEAIYLYPSLCLFEGTPISIGRGTNTPFEIYGHPKLTGNYNFTPLPNNGSKNPKQNGKTCYGKQLNAFAENFPDNNPRINLSWLIESYNALNKPDDFFSPFFDKLAGTDSLRKMIQQGYSEKDIIESWQDELNLFKEIRKKYLLYPDFE